MNGRLLFLLLLSSCLILPQVQANTIEDWKDQILYFVLIDRFENGNTENDHEVDTNDLNGFHGGDIAGLIKRLDYLDNLGVTGIWLSPVFKNRPGRFFKHQPYHGYWPYDFWTHDERFTTAEELLQLRQQTRTLKMKLVLDMVVNHMGYDAPFASNNPEWFNPPLQIKDWHDKKQLIDRQIYGLPDFASQKSVVKTFFKVVARHWFDKMQPDGFRLDAVKHVPIDFWQDFNNGVAKMAGADFLLLGEYLHGDPQEASEIWKSGNFNSLFDFPLYYTLKEVFAEEADMRKLASRIHFDRNYPDAGLLATFLDNHDLDRFITSCGGDLEKFRLALAFLMTARGIPVLCYGDEQGLEGAHDPKPFNRRSMVFDDTSSLFKYTRQLIAMRKSSEALRRGLTWHLYADAGKYAFARITPDGVALAFFNNSNEPGQIDCELPFSLTGSPRVLQSCMGDSRALLRDGRIETFLPAKSFAVYLPETSAGYYEKSFRSLQRRLYDEAAWGHRKVVLRLKVDYLPEKAEVYVTGNADEIGNWNSEKGALAMTKVSDDEYEVEVNFPIGKIIECKCFYRLTDAEEKVTTVWQEGDNTIAEIRDSGTEFIHLNWKTFK